MKMRIDEEEKDTDQKMQEGAQSKMIENLCVMTEEKLTL